MARAYREYVDSVTGERFAGPRAGAVPSGRLVVRKRVNGRSVLVQVDREYVNTADPAYSVDRDADPELKRAAARLKKRQEARGPRGVRATFRSSRAAADALYGNNPFYAEAAEADPIDVVRDWMSTIQVRRGRGRTDFSKTKRGKAILEAMATRPATGIKMALQWLIGQSGTKRWAEVDWHSIGDFNDHLKEAWERARDSGAYVAQNWTSGGALSWYPATSGRVAAAGDLSAAEQQVVRTNRESQVLADIEEELTIAAREGRKCLAPDERKVVNRRIRRVRWLLDRPQLIADSGMCGEKDEAVCTYGSLLDDARAIRQSCSTPYNLEWPVAEATQAVEKGDDRRLYDFPSAVRRQAQERARPTVGSSREQVRSLRGSLRRDR